MKQTTTDMVGKIMDSERMGYAYLEMSDGSERQEFMVSTTR
ncbi:MAG: hypothetical protein PHY47_18830 [Lachnospiraceae bacterium]|nr:hypothetical protein [Lachnospiraceae bacterium]